MMRIAWILLVGVIAGCMSESPHRTPSLDALRKSIEPWEAQPSDIQKADSAATKYIYSILSDNAMKSSNLKYPPCTRQAAVNAGLAVSPSVDVPKEFTIDGRSFSVYQKKYNSYRWNGVKRIVISYFDPQEFPNWKEIGGVDGGFSAYFTITVDMTSSQVIEHTAFPM